MKKVAVTVLLFLFVPLFAFGEGANVSGNIKFYLFDTSEGDAGYLNSEGVPVSQSEESHSSAGLSRTLMYINKPVTEKLSANLDIQWVVNAAATPRLGDSISRSSDSSITTEIFQANVTYLLPGDFQITAGKFLPKFSWDYGYNLFWHENYNGWFVSTIPYLAAWFDTGIELYKNFDFENLSLPAYFYIMNGDGNHLVDNNDSRSMMIHMTPELFNGRLKFLGSYVFGKYDNEDKKDFMKYALGITVDFEKIIFRSEYFKSEYDDSFIILEGRTKDIEIEGYYAKLIYKITPDFHIMAGYDSLEMDFSNFWVSLTSQGEQYKTSHLMLKYVVDSIWTITLNFDDVDAERDDGITELDYKRYTLGSIITF